MHRLVKLISLALISITLFAVTNHAQAQRGRDWELLGRRDVGFIADRDIIPVGRKEGRFKKIKLIVKGNDIEMRDLKVVYGNGASDDLPVRERIRAGGETRAIDLKGESRAIREIRLAYASRPNFRGQATVEVWGLQD